MTNLEKLRRDRGLDQMELAELTGVSQSTISRIERGSGVLLGTAQALAKALGCSVEELTREAVEAPDDATDLAATGS